MVKEMADLTMTDLVKRLERSKQTKRFTVDAPHIEDVTLKTICDFIAEVEYEYQEGRILQGV